MSKRSIVIDGTTTSIFLEDAFWHELDSRSKESGQPWYELVREMLDHIKDPKNRSSAIKESLLVNLREECEKARQKSTVSTWNIQSADGQRSCICTGSSLVVGRSPDNDLVIPENKVSRKHLMLIYDGDDWWVMDLKSKNGTFVNSKPVAAQKLSNKDKVMIGATSIQLQH